MDTVGSSVNAYFPQLEGRPRYNEDGAMGLHAYIPFWDYKGIKDGTAGTPRSSSFMKSVGAIGLAIK